MGTKAQPTTEAIAAALFGGARQAVLRLMLENAHRRFYLRQIVRGAGKGSGAMQRELKRLTNCGILVRTTEGRQTYYQANRSCPVFEELRGLIRKTVGAAGLLRAGIQPLADRIRIAFVFGSMAQGGDSDRSDVDVMVVSDDLALREVVRALRAAQHELQREVNPSLYRADEFRRKLVNQDTFLSNVTAGPKIFLVGGERELAELASIRIPDAPSDQSAGDR